MIGVDDDVLRVLTRYAFCDGERVRLPNLREDLRRRVNDALVMSGAVYRDGEYWYHPGGCSPLILAARFRAKGRPKGPRPVNMFEEHKMITVVRNGAVEEVRPGDLEGELEGLPNGLIRVAGVVTKSDGRGGFASLSPDEIAQS